jgi:hypothetical protein
MLELMLSNHVYPIMIVGIIILSRFEDDDPLVLEREKLMQK